MKFWKFRVKGEIRFFVLLFLVATSLPLMAQAPSPLDDFPASSPTPNPDVETYNDTEFGTALALSQTISQSTGIAMSPLLGMGALGAWQYYKADDVDRDSLPWYSNPWVWGTCLVVFLLLKSNDTAGAWIPELVKKPITVLDSLTDKASALIVALAVIPPWVLNEFKNLQPSDSADGSVATIPFVFPVLLVVLVVSIFTVVWFAFSALSSIKVMSPSSLINSGIALVKGGFMALFVAVAALNPWIALTVSLAIIGLCVLIFGWSFRWNVFGTLFVKDFFTGAFSRPLHPREELKCFTTSHFPGVKPRTYGRITRVGDTLVFTWSPWLILPAKRATICLTGVEACARKGLLLPSITLQAEASSRHLNVIDFRLRFRSQTEEICSRLALYSVRPIPVLGSARACWNWIKEQLQQSPVPFESAIKQGTIAD